MLPSDFFRLQLSLSAPSQLSIIPSVMTYAAEDMQQVRELLYILASVAIVMLVYLFDFGGIHAITHAQNTDNNGVNKSVTLEMP